jgi:hypothetical protein
MWRFAEPGLHHAIDVGSVGPWMFAMHPLPVQSDAKFMHFHGGLQARYLRCLLLRRADCSRSALTEARNDIPPANI